MLAVGLVWVFASGSPSEPAQAGQAERPEETGPGGEVPVADPNTPTRVLEVLVEGCRGPAADALVFVKVNEELVSGTTDPHGKVRIKARVGPAEVRARVAGWEGMAEVRADQPSVVVRSCRGAEVKGHIIFSGYRTPVTGVTVRLLDGSGQTLDEVESDFHGAYRLSDLDLEASSVVVDAGDHGEATEEVLAPLRSGEVRELDFALGASFELVGWVVDTRGDPVSGVYVSITAENAGVSWRSVTDQGGGFRFERAPLQALRLTADGGDLGLVSRRVVPFEERRMDVTLVLEPTGTLIVSTPSGVRGRVLVQNWSSPLIQGALPEPSPEEYYPPPTDHEEAPSTETPTVEPELEQLNGVLTKALSTYDENDPVESLVRFLGAMREGMPELEQTLRGELGQLAPGEDKTFEELARLAAKKLIETDPSALDAFAYAAERVRDGMTGVEALMAASQEMDARKRADTETVPEEVNPEFVFEDPELAGEAHATDVPIDEVPMDELPMGEVAVGPPSVSPLYERLSEQFGGLVSPYFQDDSGLVAQGGVGEELRVPGAFRYNVLLILDEIEPDGTQYSVPCGEVLVPAGRTIEMVCGAETEAALTGKVVDARGRPVEGARVILDGEQETETDRFGAWTLTYNARTAIPCSVRVAKEGAIDEQWRPSERINLQCVPGGVIEVAPITLRREEEAPLLRPDEPFGGVGGALEQGLEGVVLAGIRADGPLALDGIDEQSTIIKVDDEDATSWPVEEMLARLRGDVGTFVQLQVRGPDGELIETTIERALVTP
ncbi:MAG TPA: carboxypeptidase regulatory-like domain-containing protein [Myxococcota bacterium]|nr:carboxypeptidase regulatory-like domain-containing protein [Myxococcota bacterium]